MSYSVTFTGAASQQTIGLPESVFVALNGTLRDIARDPWANTTPDQLEDSPAFRWAPFDNGLGAIHVYIDDHASVVRVHDVTWVG